jgi:hypothetical protein
MTLEKYLNQDPETRQSTWSVKLKREEVSYRLCWEKAYVQINTPSLSSYEYVTDEKQKWALYTTDEDGNKKSPCVFSLDFDIF